jgi:peptide-methionine (S)-S-oxide reductase
MNGPQYGQEYSAVSLDLPFSSAISVYFALECPKVKNKEMERAYFATGCFWGAERRYWQIDGVVATSVGYMGGSVANPSYEKVCTGRTGHAEIVSVEFDPTVVNFRRLVEEFWVMHDPTSLNQQGNDIGSQYRSAIFTPTADQMREALITRDLYQVELDKAGLGKIVTDIDSADGKTYWPAEEYHQKYLRKNPHGYDCHSTTGIAFPRVYHV